MKQGCICSVWRCLIHVLRNGSNSLKFRWALAILNWIQTRSTFQRSCTHFRYSYEIYQVRWLSWLGHIHLYKHDSTLSRCSRQLLPDHIFCQRLLESLFHYSGSLMFPLTKQLNILLLPKWGSWTTPRWDFGTLQRAPASFTAAEGLGDGSSKPKLLSGARAARAYNPWHGGWFADFMGFLFGL